MAYIPTWKERLEDAKVYLGPAVAGLVVVALGAWVVWHELVPKEKAARETARVSQDDAARAKVLRRLADEVDVLEKTYQRALEAGEGDAAITTHLNRLIARQRERVKLDPAGASPESERLTRFEAERELVRTRTAAARSLRLEREAAAAPGSLEALEKLRDALRWQRDANAAARSSRDQDPARERRLLLAVEEAEAEPARTGLATALALARSAAARGQRDAALKEYQVARAHQAELSRLHPQLPEGNSARLGELDLEIEAVRESGLAETAAAREREADAAARAGQVKEALAAYASAAALQRELGDKYPRVKEAALKRIDQLEVKQQTLQSAAGLARAAALDREVASLLRDRLCRPAAEKIATAVGLLEQAAADQPRSTLHDAALRQRLVYLGLRAAELDALQQLVWAHLATPVASGGAVFFRTEVSQDLYQRIMNANPSRNPGRTLPVDSVTWTEAQEFCRRLGWVLGTGVRLPTEAEFRAVFLLSEQAWSLANSGGRSHDVGKSAASPQGLFDLAGNVGEWLQATEAATTAPVGGGSFGDAPDAVRAAPVVAVDKKERSARIGFRFVVEKS